MCFFTMNIETGKNRTLRQIHPLAIRVAVPEPETWHLESETVHSVSLSFQLITPKF
jgi:hypothetical protein